MLCLEKSGATIVPTQRVLKKEEHAFLLEGQAIITAAQHEAALIKQQALAEAETKRQEGFNKGQDEGKAAIADQILATMTQSAAYFSRVEDVMIDLVMRSVRHVLGEMDQRAIIERIVHRALESTRNENQVTVRVSPRQADGIKARINDLVTKFPKIQFLDVQPDTRLPEDGCVLETEIGVVDASLEAQLKAIEKALVRAMK